MWCYRKIKIILRRAKFFLADNKTILYLNLCAHILSYSLIYYPNNSPRGKQRLGKDPSAVHCLPTWLSRDNYYHFFLIGFLEQISLQSRKLGRKYVKDVSQRALWEESCTMVEPCLCPICMTALLSSVGTLEILTHPLHLLTWIKFF